MDYAKRYLNELKEDYPSYYKHLQLTHTLLDLATDFQKRAAALEEALYQYHYHDKNVLKKVKSRRELEVTKGFISKWIVNHVYSEMVDAFAIQREEYYEDHH